MDTSDSLLSLTYLGKRARKHKGLALPIEVIKVLLCEGPDEYLDKLNNDFNVLFFMYWVVISFLLVQFKLDFFSFYKILYFINFYILAVLPFKKFCSAIEQEKVIVRSSLEKMVRRAFGEL